MDAFCTRNAKIADAYCSGQTLQAVGDAFGLTRERVRQICAKAGISATHGGMAVQRNRNQERFLVARDAKYLAKYGHGYTAHLQLRGIGRKMMQTGVARERTPVGAFSRQRQSAKTREIEWRLTLADWWRTWQESGLWDQRGRGQAGYVMSRYGDSGAYETGNVFIQHSTVNSSCQHRKQSGLPMGVRVFPHCRKPFVAKIMRGGKMFVIGKYETPEAAGRAYSQFNPHASLV